MRARTDPVVLGALRMFTRSGAVIIMPDGELGVPTGGIAVPRGVGVAAGAPGVPGVPPLPAVPLTGRPLISLPRIASHAATHPCAFAYFTNTHELSALRAVAVADVLNGRTARTSA